MTQESGADHGTVSAQGPRDENQDAVLSVAMNSSSEDAIVLVVCDGVGGRPGGKQASRLAVREIAALIVPELLESNRDSGGAGGQIQELLERALLAANRRVVETGSRDPDVAGMASTAVVAVVSRDKAYVGWAGDSRAFVFGKSGLRQLTVDHRADPSKGPANMITRYLGQGDDFVPELMQCHVAPGDVLILCTDGLTDALTASQIKDTTHDVLANGGRCDALTRELVRQALDVGATDNVTAACCEVCWGDATQRELVRTGTSVNGYTAEIATRLKWKTEERHA